MPGTQPTVAGWYPDPAGSGGQRWHDGEGWTAQVSHGAPTRALGQPFARMADWLGRLLWLWGALYLLAAALPAWLWLNPPPIDLPVTPATGQAPAPAPAAPEQLSTAVSGLLIGMLVLLLLLLCTGVLWLVWQYQLAVTAPGALRRSPASHVWWWFVPIASYWIPRSNIGDLWHAYGSQRRGEPADPTPVVFSLWWACWISPALMQPLLVMVLLRAATPDDAVRSMFAVSTVTMVLISLAAFTARVVVRDLSWRALLFWSDAR